MAWLLVAPIGLTLASAVQAQIYTGQIGDGAVVLSNFQSDEAPRLLVMSSNLTAGASASANAAGLVGARESATVGAVPRLPQRYLDIIIEVAREYGIPAALVAAVAAAESGFDPDAKSAKGAGGLMQLMPSTAQRFNVRDRFSAKESLRGGAAYLSWLDRRFDSDLEKMLAAYNAGEQAVERAGGVPPYAETQAYVPRVLHYMQYYARTLSPPPG